MLLPPLCISMDFFLLNRQLILVFFDLDDNFFLTLSTFSCLYLTIAQRNRVSSTSICLKDKSEKLFVVAASTFKANGSCCKRYVIIFWNIPLSLVMRTCSDCLPTFACFCLPSCCSEKKKRKLTEQ